MKEKDMRMPGWLCGLGVFLIMISVACIVVGVLYSLWALVGTVIALGLGVASILCWKNQWVEMLNEQEFVYSTMFGKKSRYLFSQITDLKQNSDSMTLFVGDRKIHIESCAILSERLTNANNGALLNK